jgi:hypothetical protein
MAVVPSREHEAAPAEGEIAEPGEAAAGGSDVGRHGGEEVGLTVA